MSKIPFNLTNPLRISTNEGFSRIMFNMFANFMTHLTATIFPFRKCITLTISYNSWKLIIILSYNAEADTCSFSLESGNYC